MDKELQTLLDLASERGNHYVKGDCELSGLHTKMSELGVLLLEKAKRLPGMDESRIKDELIEIQNKLDDLRKAIFASKIKTR
ncbi:MAG: hypothetical protein ACYC69_08165 [Thermodesulfovibrionales bacterium]